MDTDTSREPGGEEEPTEDEDDGGHRTPFDPAKDDDSPLGDTDQHSDADA